MTDPNWSTICSEIAVALYGTTVVGEQDGWPLCVHPLNECKLGRYGRDPTTLHTYRYAPVPRYHEDLGYLKELKDDLLSMRGWVCGSRTSGKREHGRAVVWVNKPPISPNRSLVGTSTRALNPRWSFAYTLAIHKALMEEAVA